MTYLLDINVLIALFDPGHVHHQAAHRWFATVGSLSWATCPLTENGFVRVISSPSYQSISDTSAEAAHRLGIACGAAGHFFWPDTLSITDTDAFDLSKLHGHRQITDVYLAALAHRYTGKLATFDRNIPVSAIIGASPSLIELIPTT